MSPSESPLPSGLPAGALSNEPQKPRGLPPGLWGCGAGCLLSLAILIGATWWGMSRVLESTGPEVAWPVVAEVLPFGPEPPEHFTASLVDFAELARRPLVRFMMRGLDMDKSQAEELAGQQVLLLVERFDSDKPAGTGSLALLWRLPEGGDISKVPEPLVFRSGDGAESTRTPIEVELQGRTLTALHYVTEGHSSPFAPKGKLEILEVDLTGERTRPLLLKLISTGDQHADQAELQRFLEPFQVWEGR